MNYFISFILAFFLVHIGGVFAQSLMKHDQPNALNPLLPGYFADPTIKKIGDTYYIYATTDGNGWGAGPSQVWTSKDFRHWTIQPMNWPNTHWYWAPDMTRGYDGRYYLYYSQPVEIFGAVSENPIGPWKSLAPDDKSIIPNYMIPGVITLDAQTFTDDDGRIYMFWGTWGVYPDHGCAVGLLNKDMKSFEKIQLIPNTVAKDFFEAPFMFKRNGVYYMMYSSGHCEDHTYRVQYIKSSVGPMGPFEYPVHNPILVTNEDGSVHGPGHHSILEEEGRYYIVYHRHNNPHSGGGFHRQVAVDELFFTPDGEIINVVPTHQGVSSLLKTDPYPIDLALGKEATVSSYYNNDFRPSFVLDNNNGTLWRAKENHQPAWLNIDLGKLQEIQTVLIQFEYPTYAYQYRIETSEDGMTWTEFTDQSKNARWASPVLEHGKSMARFVRLHILNTQIPGLPRGVWNIKVYSDRLEQETLWSDVQNMPSSVENVDDLIHLDASEYREGDRLISIQNKGQLAGNLSGDQQVLVKNYQGKKAFFFDGSVALRSTFGIPPSLGGNSSYTVSMWVNNPHIARFENVLAWSKGNKDLTKAIFGVGSDPQRGAVVHGAWPDLGYSSILSADEWHHVVLSFDGYMERIYVDGVLQQEENRMLFVNPGDAFIVGASDVPDNNFSGYLADLKVYNKEFSAEVIKKEIVSSPDKDVFFALQTDNLDLGKIHALRNHGTVRADEIPIEDGEVVVQGNRIGLKISDLKDSTLANILQAPDHTLEFDWFDGRTWNYALYTHKEGDSSFYLNGKLQNIKKLRKLITIKENGVSFTNAFHALRAYKEKITPNEVSERYQIWKAKLSVDLVNYTPCVKNMPHYINDRSVFIQLEEEKQGVWYMFSSGGINSGWVQEPYYLLDGAKVDESIEVLIRDEFGNVSQMLSSIIDPHKPKLLSPHMSDVFTLSMQDHRDTMPFWDGYQVSINRDTTQTSIELTDGSWTIRSTHTKWGDDDLLPPFIYKEIDGDFTFEVKVNDVVGLISGNRTSNEAGIMIQDTENPKSYINNTILTGWNLGNLVRSVGARIHQEGNNGSGLTFDSFIQIQKTGSHFYVRSSNDGIFWKDLPNTPFRREDLLDKRLKVGLYQVSTNNLEGFGKFALVKMWR